MAYFWTSPLDVLAVNGTVDFVHTAGAPEDHALEIDVDAAGFGDVKALDIVFITGAIGAGDDEEAMLVNIDESASTGGDISGYEVIATAEGSATIHGYTTGININPILHNSGAFGNADDILNKAVDVTAALASGGAGTISVFVSDNDTMTYGDAAQFNEMEIILGTAASGAGIAPTFEYSTGGTGFSAFTPADGTNGFRNNGAILWIAADLAGWIANATGFFEVRQTRTRNSLGTTPILDEVQIVSATEYTWDSSGDVTINSLTLTTDLTVPNGGTGASTFTDNALLRGQVAGALSPSTVLVSDAGEMTNASQPAFSAYLATGDANLTGDDTLVSIGDTDVGTTLTEIFDQNADFTPGASGGAIFTAPVTGRYGFVLYIAFGGILSTHTNMSTQIVTSNRSYISNVLSPFAAMNVALEIFVTKTAFTDMDASDTTTFNVTVFNGTKVIDIIGAAAVETGCQGWLEC